MTLHKTRVRFAPSPTGDLHIGNARTALFNWLFARQQGGSFILRIENTDRERASLFFERNLLDDLKWLSLEWDEGPEKGGEFGPYHQIERLEIYDYYLRKLIDHHFVYPCYCTEEELEDERVQLLAMRMAPRYGGKCLHLTEGEKRKLESEGKTPVYRFHVNPGSIEFNDLIRGPMKFEADTLGDFIIVRSNGIPSYNFAVVIDDHLMAITHVIRGEDHLSNTALQMLLYSALDFSPPVFAHHSLILGKDRTKLSKRHGSVSVRDFRSKGILPEALFNYLSLSGGSIGEGREVVSVDEIIEVFSLAKVGRSGAIFDEGKLRWLNAVYIRNCDTERLSYALLPFIREAGYEPEQLGQMSIKKIAEALRDNLVTLADVGEYMDIFLDERYRLSKEVAPALKGDAAARVIISLREALSGESVTGGNLYADALKTIQAKTGLKTKEVLMTVRAAITGRNSGPELEKIFNILGRESVLKRLEVAMRETIDSP
jgi:nondiscriminating glutamyl-tRNA synthetase